jgi:hypothetical protein
LWDRVPFITAEEVEKLKEVGAEFREEAMRRSIPGLLNLISIPCGQVDNFVYNSEAYAFFPQKEKRSAELWLSKYTSGDSWNNYTRRGVPGFTQFNKSQARVTDLCYETYGRNMGIQITLIDSLDDDIKTHFKNAVNKIISASAPWMNLDTSSALLDLDADVSSSSSSGDSSWAMVDHEPDSPPYHPGSPSYSPSSPYYTPASPAYSPSDPVYATSSYSAYAYSLPASNPASAYYDPTAPSSS